jgi:hypothetical protein
MKLDETMQTEVYCYTAIIAIIPPWSMRQNIVRKCPE